ncbi:1,4-alpha-glucan branching enzyme [Cytobacillus solani]|uniref:1,4-alpha-glucan branching enzyme GlgB n=1 Tax=Cytobacillus solani TaxID=1637975 RepID=A0A0Q3SMU8_9BACI|nr:1,4-alpha-glucan branching enzyme [Cytobacillus solani]KOP83863.1 glycogen branching protein [Bacillus sp. FJAT-21945]KQL20940.1 glycogen branching protein [Cytobacillus solani]
MNTVTDYEMHLFHEGTLYESYRLFGAHLIKENERINTRFCVWAPNAQSVRLVGNFNNWNGERFQLHRVNNEGIWSILIKGDMQGCIYKYEVITQDGRRILKADPFSFFSEVRPRTASIVYSLEGYDWKDCEWIKKRQERNHLAEPMAIYEVHIGSWRKHKDESYLSYKELAVELIPYVKELGFTHIELLPLTEHPLDESWGYQGTGYYSVTSRYGTPKEFMHFIDQCHQHNIGVILDWVPGHFCKDEHGLFQFDGSFLYEYERPVDRENAVWGTANFDLGKKEVQSFLISNARFWMEYYHIDGLRIDAVANILYWPNRYGENNPYGTHFLKTLNQTILLYDSSFLLTAEDSTAWPGVTYPVQYGGLGFNYKWNMGWMNDILMYMEASPEQRKYLHGKITFSLLYAFKENFVLPLSHDEVVHGKKSLLNKMPGDYWQKFAQYRLLLGLMMAHPGKKLLFMGFELGQFDEWKDQSQLDWNLLEYEMHRKLNAYVKELLAMYHCSKPLHELDSLSKGFEWIDVHNHQQSIFSFIRKEKEEEEHLVVVCNFTERVYHDYQIGVPQQGSYQEIFNSDHDKFGGSHLINTGQLQTENMEFHGKPSSLKMTIPPFGISILRPIKHRKERNENGQEKVHSHAISWRKRKPASLIDKEFS